VTRGERLGWAAAACLTVACALEARLLLHRGPGFATLPIFVPASLAHEKAMRAERGQPAGKGGVEAVELAETLLRDPSVAGDPTLAAEVQGLSEDRARLLEARNRRHALNIRLMDVGVEVARELTPAQWDAIHMRRDEVRGKAERDLFARLLEKVRGDAAAGSPPSTPDPGAAGGALRGGGAPLPQEAPNSTSPSAPPR
jgi:hypothetical protein